MLTRARRNYQDGPDFDAVEFELEREEIFRRSENLYYEPLYEVDSDPHYPDLYRVWLGMVMLGTFYKKHGRWLANAYFKNRIYLGLGESKERRFRSNQMALDYITNSYEGK